MFTRVLKLHITDSQYSMNIADESGGAIYIENGPTITILNTSFQSNSANKDDIATEPFRYGGGGAIYASYCGMELNNCTLKHNTATAAKGGAISTYETTWSIIGSEFMNNGAADGT